ncbi:epoxide hydrolase family protein [Streptomyces sp. NPDC051555]|uniref:epoxide hydrolase family protein n=1 Tax=Streptomyces sp. NPDC051555 TaxID=3365657 RepID=UPI0037A5C2D4
MTENTSIQPYRIDIPQADLDFLQARLDTTRWPDEATGVGWDYGIPLAYMQDLAAYWRDEYDWRAQEAFLNTFPQFTTVIDGQNVHFLHVRSPEPTATPMIITHGFPSSVVEFLDVIGPLTDPQAHGGAAGDAFHLVIPAMPGFGFSGPTPEPWEPRRIAQAWAELMHRLGYDKYLAQGGDWGHMVSLELGRIDADHVIGVHVNNVMAAPTGTPGELDGLSADDRRRLDKQAGFSNRPIAAGGTVQAARPQTLAYGLTDSPVGQLAWILDPIRECADLTGVPEDVFDRNRLLTNVMMYWITGTASSSARQYKLVSAMFARHSPTTFPLAVAVYHNDIGEAIRRLVDRDHKNVVRWMEFDHGGHYPAWEQPATFTADLRGYLRDLREAGILAD